MPIAARLLLRGWLARRKRERIKAVWPICPGSERPPSGWPGWPEGKQFAFVLTHDVEDAFGLTQCRRLMEMEMEHGFRSSFNLVPEGEYKVSPDLIHDLRQNGFEVGVHDLNHDGKLYSNRRSFSDKARRINRYLKEWGAVGFRSGFMLRELDWIGELNMEYDASTFDTDPFEPQPDGAGTIFPFWVGRPSLAATRPAGKSHADDSLRGDEITSNGNGYVELPYTLAQDSTLFLLLRERTISIWKQKLEWIVEMGGMALVNVHPDYMDFEVRSDKFGRYPACRYDEFLGWVKQHYRDRYWHAVPSQVAKYFSSRCHFIGTPNGDFVAKNRQETESRNRCK